MTCTVVHPAPPAEGSHPGDVLAWAAQRYAGRLTCAISLGVEDCALISLAAERGLTLNYFSLDTGVLFPETYALWKDVETKYGVKIHALKPVEVIDRLWEREPDRCCQLRKVEPLKRHLAGFEAWVTGIRREQSKDRANAQLVEADLKFGLTKVNPLVAWTQKDVWRYVNDHGVPYNPLHDRGYPSIGCAPCTSSVAPGEDARAGRWRGQTKTECGLHSKESE
jgi:phosphoadenylyl-sulfate reductase (thioredoxin)